MSAGLLMMLPNERVGFETLILEPLSGDFLVFSHTQHTTCAKHAAPCQRLYDCSFGAYAYNIGSRNLNSGTNFPISWDNSIWNGGT